MMIVMMVMIIMIIIMIIVITVTGIILLLKFIIILDLIEIIEMFHHNHHIPWNFLSLIIISLNIAYNNNFSMGIASNLNVTYSILNLNHLQFYSSI